MDVNGGNSDSDCSEYENRPYTENKVTVSTNRYYDGAYLYALALDDMIRKKCPGAFTDRSVLNSCVKGKELLPFMKNISFTGLSGDIQFNTAGDMLAEYIIYQYINKNNTHSHNIIGSWNQNTDSLNLFENMVDWSMLKEDINGYESVSNMPSSVCSLPCANKQFPVRQELPCCWICSRCRNNEIIVNSSSCSACPRAFWPDEVNATDCVSIEPTYMKPTDIIASCLIGVNALMLIVAIIFIMIFFINKKMKLIKASGKEFMAIILVGITLAYIIAFLFVLKPTREFCFATHFGFNIAATLIYVPLLVKTVRVYRIFAASEKFDQNLRCLSLDSQMAVMLILFLLQVGA